MELNDLTKSAITEIGNLCIAGGSNKISCFSDELVDISVVDAQIRDIEDLQLELNAEDSCKVFAGTDISGDVNGQFFYRISEDIIPTTLSKFPKLNAVKDGKEQNESLLELINNFCIGFTEGMESMTGISAKVSDNVKLIEELNLNDASQKVLCYNSIISVGNDRIDFDVYFFSDAEKLIPKFVEALGLE